MHGTVVQTSIVVLFFQPLQSTAHFVGSVGLEDLPRGTSLIELTPASNLFDLSNEWYDNNCNDNDDYIVILMIIIQLHTIMINVTKEMIIENLNYEQYIILLLWIRKKTMSTYTRISHSSCRKWNACIRYNQHTFTHSYTHIYCLCMYNDLSYQWTTTWKHSIATYLKW